MKIDQDHMVRAIQRAYPQIWFACHRAHRRRVDDDDLSDHEAAVLLHLAGAPDQTPSALARHLGIGRPALSAQLKRLLERGLVQVARGQDARVRHLRITPTGAAKASARAPLDADRVRELLAQLTPTECTSAVHGLQLLATAARRLGAP